MEVLGTRTWLDIFSCFSVSLCYLFASFDDWGEDSISLESAVPSIAWFHQLGGEPSPSDHLLVKSTLAGAQRLLAHQMTKKEPITVSQLEQLVASKAYAMASLYNIRSVVICLLAFAAFLRFDELAC